MKHRFIVILGTLLASTLVAYADADTGRSAVPPARTAKTSAPVPTSPAVKKAATKDEVRTLDAIRIEGEIDVPQVLFITARDYRRFRDGTGTKYQATPSDVAKSVPLPSRLRMVAPPSR